MFDWLRTRWARARREIFTYWDGSRKRAIDPIHALLQLEAHPTFHMDRHTKGADAGDIESVQIVQQAIRDVFGVENFNPEKNTGLLLGEQLLLFYTFMLFLGTLKKSTRSTPTSSPSTEDLTSSESSEPIMKDMLASSSTDGEVTSDQPTE